MTFIQSWRAQDMYTSSCAQDMYIQVGAGAVYTSSCARDKTFIRVRVHTKRDLPYGVIYSLQSVKRDLPRT